MTTFNYEELQSDLICNHKMEQVISTVLLYGAVVFVGFNVGVFLGAEVHPDGKRSVLVKSGDIYEGDWVKGKFVGRGQLIKPNGQVFRGEWILRTNPTSKYAFSTTVADHAKTVLSLPVMIGISGIYRDMRSYAAVVGEESITVLNYLNLLTKTATKESISVHTVIVDSSAQSFAFTVDAAPLGLKKCNPF